ncbi:hypothetical protein CCR75_009262 [Bremia lactucae]|uniref:Uncharacterized protein n=1 Tax=Bremia lactucae TaxID=4779 RepID=A0A976FJM3_BRELC|nr:hypothetical protein CCR75_009262 [Bremia lactucae]
MKLTSTLLFELKMREICVNCSEQLSATGRAGTSVVERSIAAIGFALRIMYHQSVVALDFTTTPFYRSEKISKCVVGTIGLLME